MAYGKLNQDGTLSSANKQHEGFVELSLFETKEEGSHYAYYKPDMVNGKYAPDMVKEDEATALAEAIVAKDAKVKALDELVITHNTVAYDADGKSIGNMSAVMGVANFKYTQLITIGLTVEGSETRTPVMAPTDAYEYIYKMSKVWWKGNDNKPHEVMIESVCEALEKSMLGVSDILGL